MIDSKMSNHQLNISFFDVVFVFDALMNISDFDKIRLTILMKFFWLFYNVSFRVFFRFFFAIIIDFEIFFLNVSVERMMRKIFRTCFVFVEKFKFLSFLVVVASFVITLNEITMFNRNTEEKMQNEQDSSLEKSSNNVESSHSNASSSSL